jgi:peptidoglycan/xylan/chitin deacetylase (PgdA/CDA1 family)
MAAYGIEFGSHTSSHPVLANVDPDSLEEEIAGSKRTIERELGREVIAFAYPVGGKGHFTGPVQEVVKRANYRYAVSYEEGLAGDDWQDRYALPRIHIESDHSLSLFRANLMFPQAMLRP